MTQVVQPEALAFCDGYASRDCCRPQVVSYKARSVKRLLAVFPDGRKEEIGLLGVGRLFVPFAKLLSQNRMHRNITVRRLGLGFSIFAVSPPLRYADLPFQ